MLLSSLRVFGGGVYNRHAASNVGVAFAVASRSYSSVAAKRKYSKRFLITGSLGQIGIELARALRTQFGEGSVIHSDIRKPERFILEEGPFMYLDVRDYNNLSRIVVEERVDVIVHLASLLSATAEANVMDAIAINNQGAFNVLEAARKHQLAVFAPSSIAAFGPSTPQDRTPDDTIMRPTSIYGITKVYGELLGEYYNKRYGVDYRSLRYPGIISSEAAPGGGTTDYAVDIFYAATLGRKYTCYLSENSTLPMIYMRDVLRATMQFVTMPRDKLSRCVYNLGGISFSPLQIASAIQERHVSDFRVRYEPDPVRQGIANSWPRSLDDTLARNDWGWTPEFDLEAIVDDMMSKLGKKKQE